MKDSEKEAVEKGRAHFMETLGNIPEPIDVMMKQAPGLFAGYLTMREWILRENAGPEEGLDLKTRELIYVLLDIVTGNEDGAKNHLNAAMKAGLTVPELMDGCMQVMHVCGVTAWGKTGHKVVSHAIELQQAAER